MLILAGTPIGNLGDATPRLIQTLVSATHIAAEDTRVLKSLANHLGIKLSAKIMSLHEHNEGDQLEKMVELAKVGDLVLVSDAGMPTISDPGFRLVRACVEQGIEVQIVPGPSAVLSALAVSGLPTDRFCFEGFVPRKSSDRKKLFANLATEPRTMVFFESPHRIKQTLEDAISVFGENRKAAISRELTKKFEQTLRGSLAKLLVEAEEIRGELVLVVAGVEAESLAISELVSQVNELVESGWRLKLATQSVAKLNGVSASKLYDLVIKSQSKTVSG